MSRRGKEIKYTMEEVLDAIEKSGGIVSTIAKKLGCAWNTADKWINNWEATKRAYANENEKMLDIAENVVYNSIQSGNTQDAKWLLSLKARHRGFNEKSTVELANKDGEAFKTVQTIIYIPDNGRTKENN